ncbi:MAG: DUF58 domain-containing protein, partial [Proteobacteria bacterium]|nr:DUF58 domain-containing protein [Pseudomonadota bacterium]
MISPELRKKIKRLTLWSQRKLDSQLHGAYQSKIGGSGLEFDEFRSYVYGDDLKHIDWKVTARSQRPYIRKFKEERDRSVVLMVDVSGSMYFGSEKGAEKITK